MQRERAHELVVGNWTTMKMASYRGSTVFVSALRFLNNYVHQNDATKASLIAASIAPIGSLHSTTAENAREKSNTLLSLVFQLAVPREDAAGLARASRDAQTHAVLRSTCCAILTSLLLNVECQMWAIKSGLIAKLLGEVQRRLRSHSQTNRSDPTDTQTLTELLGILASSATTDEGRHALYSSSNSLEYIFEDILHSSLDGERSSAVLQTGCLFIRNLSLSKVSKSYFGVWESSLDRLLKPLVMQYEGSQSSDVVALQYLSCTLWSLVYDNQKARTLLLSRPPILRRLGYVLMARKSGTVAPPTRLYLLQVVNLLCLSVYFLRENN